VDNGFIGSALVEHAGVAARKNTITIAPVPSPMWQDVGIFRDRNADASRPYGPTPYASVGSYTVDLDGSISGAADRQPGRHYAEGYDRGNRHGGS